jgi:hypothetical protein
MSSPFRRLSALVAAAAALLVLPSAASAQLDAVSTFSWTKNMHPLGHSARNVPLENASPVDGIYNSDLAFWGKTAFQGTYEGFRIVDVSDPENPVEVNNYAECSPGTTQGNQGDVVVWGDILVRSWNSPAGPPPPATVRSWGWASRACTSSTSATRAIQTSLARCHWTSCRTR